MFGCNAIIDSHLAYNTHPHLAYNPQLSKRAPKPSVLPEGLICFGHARVQSMSHFSTEYPNHQIMEGIIALS
jgi:hypothetical protein